MNRREFLKAIGIGGACIAGNFVIHDPVVLAGDLIAPNPEPTIVQATTMPERIDYVADAYVVRWEVQRDPIAVHASGDRWQHYVQRLPQVRCELQLTGEPSSGWQELMSNGNGKVRLFVVGTAGK